MNHFSSSPEAIHQLLHNIRPLDYGKTRNFINGAVTYLSPYISRGVISTRDVFDHLKNEGYAWEPVEKLVQELAWRDFFQSVWIRLGDNINEDIKQPQEDVRHYQIPKALIDAKTGIEGIDVGIKNLYQTGYMHNHLRMYTASIACNVAKSYWKTPAHWMYYHLLDADWASNACSWQWVAGAFSQKKYYANQENINKYTTSRQRNSYLDVSYEQIGSIEVPEILQETVQFTLTTNLPETDEKFSINENLPTLIYNWYNMDFKWHQNLNANRILLLEPEVFEKYPISDLGVKFLIELSQNILGIQVFKGSFQALKTQLGSSKVIFKEHPLNQYQGNMEARRFLTPMPNKSFNSFFGYWKYIEKSLRMGFER
jgi:deoxyribodipyrimidine photo-lyase